MWLKRAEPLKPEVALEAETLRWWMVEVRKGVEGINVMSGASSVTTDGGADILVGQVTFITGSSQYH